MTKKRNTTSDPILSGGAAPARPRKHTPAKRTAEPVVESSPSTHTTTQLAALDAAVNPSNPVVTEDSTSDANAIAQLAYSYWEARGYQGGSPEEDWLRAEKELRGSLVS